jgi:hypothetical protein
MRSAFRHRDTTLSGRTPPAPPDVCSGANHVLRRQRLTFAVDLSSGQGHSHEPMRVDAQADGADRARGTRGRAGRRAVRRARDRAGSAPLATGSWPTPPKCRARRACGTSTRPTLTLTIVIRLSVRLAFSVSIFGRIIGGAECAHILLYLRRALWQCRIVKSGDTLAETAMHSNQDGLSEPEMRS